MKKRKSVILWSIAILALIFLFAGIYFTFIFSYNCDNLSCFKAHQVECSRTKFIYDAEETTWFFHIQGKENNKCDISVEVLQVKKGSIDRKKLEGKSMVCSLPLESIDSPESDLSLCHGILKEDLQNLIIQKLHAYIMDNVEEIGEELEKINEVV